MGPDSGHALDRRRGRSPWPSAGHHRPCRVRRHRRRVGLPSYRRWRAPHIGAGSARGQRSARASRTAKMESAPGPAILFRSARLRLEAWMSARPIGSDSERSSSDQQSPPALALPLDSRGRAIPGIASVVEHVHQPGPVCAPGCRLTRESVSAALMAPRRVGRAYCHRGAQVVSAAESGQESACRASRAVDQGTGEAAQRRAQARAF